MNWHKRIGRLELSANSHAIPPGFDWQSLAIRPYWKSRELSLKVIHGFKFLLLVASWSHK